MTLLSSFATAFMPAGVFELFKSLGAFWGVTGGIEVAAVALDSGSLV